MLKKSPQETVTQILSKNGVRKRRQKQQNKPPNAGKTVHIQPDTTPHLAIGMLVSKNHRQAGV